MATDIDDYTGQCSSMMACERVHRAIILFRPKLFLLDGAAARLSHARAAPMLALHSIACRETNGHRQAAEPHSKHHGKTGRDWPVYDH